MTLTKVVSHFLTVLSHAVVNLGSSQFMTRGFVVILSLAGILPLCTALVRDSLWLVALSRVPTSSRYCSMKEVTSFVICASFRLGLSLLVGSGVQCIVLKSLVIRTLNKSCPPPPLVPV